MRRLMLMMLFGLGACSSPYTFQTEINKFSSGIDQLSGAFTGGYASLASDEAALTQLRLTDDHAVVKLPISCAERVGTPVGDESLCLPYKDGDTPPQPRPIEMAQPRTLAVIAVLDDYAHGLAAVTNAADRTAFDAAVTQLSGAVANIANVAEPGAGAVAPAAVNLIGWIVGTALDQQRLEALKSAVNAVDKVINKPDKSPGVVDVLKDGLVALDEARRNVLKTEADTLTEKLPSRSDADYKSRYAQLIAVVTTLNQLRANNPGAAADGLKAAHAALAKAVNNPSVNYADVLKEVGDFLDKAGALKSALSASPTAAKK